MGADTAAEASDADLVASLRAGDRTALAAIYDRHGTGLYAFAVRTLGSPDDAADACQDAFVLALQRIDQLRDPSRLRPWLYAIVRHECTRIGRARARTVPMSDRTAQGDGPATTVLEPRDPDADPVGTAALRSDDAAVLRDALGGLDGRDRALFALQAVEGLAGRDLADAAGIPPRQLGQATARMRDRIERSVVSLLVSRHGRRDCPELGRILASWDGHLTVLLRKRVSRHIDDCATCTSRRAALVLPIRSALAAPLPFLAAPDHLRDRVLRRITHLGDAPAMGAGHDEQWPDGFPPRPETETETGTERGAGRRRVAMASAAVAGMVLLVMIAVALGATDTAAQEGAAPSVAPVTTSDAIPPPGPTTTTHAAPPAGAGPSATAAPPAAPSGSTAPAPTPPEPPPTTMAPPAQEPVSPTPDPVPDPPPPPADDPDPVSPAPDVEVVRTPPPLVPAGCPGPTEGLVTATASGKGLVVELLTEGDGAPGAAAMTPAGGGWRASVGPFDQPGPRAARVRVTDEEGRTATSAPFTIEVRPCVG